MEHGTGSKAEKTSPRTTRRARRKD